MELEIAVDFVDQFLGNPKPSGVTGFEGLVAILLQRATGQEFRLSSSGRKSGFNREPIPSRMRMLSCTNCHPNLKNSCKRW
jgi:hypothetical protein